MRRFMVIVAVVIVAAVALVFGVGQFAAPPVALSIVAGSENKTLEAMMMDWAGRNNMTLSVTYLGSVDISRELEKGTAGAYDAFGRPIRYGSRWATRKRLSSIRNRSCARRSCWG